MIKNTKYQSMFNVKVNFTGNNTIMVHFEPKNIPLTMGIFMLEKA